MGTIVTASNKRKPEKNNAIISGTQKHTYLAHETKNILTFLRKLFHNFTALIKSSFQDVERLCFGKIRFLVF